MEITPVLSQLQQRAGSEGLSRSRELNTETEEQQTFSDMIQDAINSVDEAQKISDQKTQDLIMGNSDNVHEVMIAMEKAQLSFQLMVEIRNKAVDTYKELSRMQI
ncbi:flagellar hook-basal body complex protein FliE [Fodinibius sediminis]|uniref:Flagellar hook-basal body complex protein FliE n=1 Tax=Fodinibius sediminis TaxID=1214077 RepID=A0A521CJ22_9BACT|nr:flagellar hook-basal body complex protein FliE [Fodinibius sediminis]SMO59457.1 flagellar hook-basal body complex protein FliE [Fodinibius sediminis]